MSKVGLANSMAVEEKSREEDEKKKTRTMKRSTIVRSFLAPLSLARIVRHLRRRHPRSRLRPHHPRTMRIKEKNAMSCMISAVVIQREGEDLFAIIYFLQCSNKNIISRLETATCHLHIELYELCTSRISCCMSGTHFERCCMKMHIEDKLLYLWCNSLFGISTS
jgi:hypothetical protein